MEQTVSHPAPLDSALIVKKAIGSISSKPRWTRAFLLSALILLAAGCDSESVSNDLRGEGDFFQPERILGKKENSESQANNSRNTGICEITKQQQHMLTLVNQARSKARSCGDTYYEAVPSLTWDCQLRDAAIAHTKDMMANNFFAHSGSDGLRAGDRITATGYNWRYYGENLAAGYTRSEDALTGLLESPGHCKNIMNPNVIEFGSYREFVKGLDYQSYWTHVFAKPM
jgi:uncharacterized protein YkwD